MAKEIERKFLVKDLSFIPLAIESRFIKQGYLAINKNLEIRVSVRDNTVCKLCIKSNNNSLIRDEFEYDIPLQDAVELLNKCERRLFKTRYVVHHEYKFWEIDVLHLPDKDLIIAEIELESPVETILIPDFIGEEVTGNPDYYNKNIAY